MKISFEIGAVLSIWRCANRFQLWGHFETAVTGSKRMSPQSFKFFKMKREGKGEDFGPLGTRYMKLSDATVWISYEPSHHSYSTKIYWQNQLIMGCYKLASIQYSTDRHGLYFKLDFMRFLHAIFGDVPIVFDWHGTR